MSDHRNGAAKKTTVEEGTQFKGALTSNCPIEVKGRIEGEVVAPALAVSETGAVQGKIKVGELTSHGELAGELDADVVQLSGVIRDNTIIRAKSLEVKLSAPNGKLQVTFGECQLDVGSEEEQAARAAAATTKHSERPGKRTSQQPPAKAESVPPNSGPNGAAVS